MPVFMHARGSISRGRELKRPSFQDSVKRSYDRVNESDSGIIP